MLLPELPTPINERPRSGWLSSPQGQGSDVSFFPRAAAFTARHFQDLVRRNLAHKSSHALGASNTSRARAFGPGHRQVLAVRCARPPRFLASIRFESGSEHLVAYGYHQACLPQERLAWLLRPIVHSHISAAPSNRGNRGATGTRAQASLQCGGLPLKLRVGEIAKSCAVQFPGRNHLRRRCGPRKRSTASYCSRSRCI